MIMKHLKKWLAAAALPLLVSQPAMAAEPTPEKAAVEAARKGDVPSMNKLKGSSVSLTGRLKEPFRTTKAYRDFLVATGPDFKIAGGQSGIEVLIRVPATLRADKLPDLIDATGTLTDFESRPQGDRLLWMPVVTISFLK